MPILVKAKDNEKDKDKLVLMNGDTTVIISNDPKYKRLDGLIALEDKYNFMEITLSAIEELSPQIGMIKKKYEVVSFDLEKEKLEVKWGEQVPLQITSAEFKELKKFINDGQSEESFVKEMNYVFIA